MSDITQSDAARNRGPINPVSLARHERQPGATPAPAALWTEAQAAAFFNVGLRKFQEMRAEGLAPVPVLLGPRSTRWIPEECIEAVRTAPRAAKHGEPEQLTRARAERAKRKAGAAQQGGEAPK